MILACLVIVVAGMKAAASILVPMLCAAFLGVLSLPFVQWLSKRGVPRSLRLACVLLGLVVTAVLLLFFLGSALSEFQAELAGYRSNLREQLVDLRAWFGERGIDMGEAVAGATDPGFVLGFAGRAAAQLGGMMSNTFVILLWMAFMLVEASGIEAKFAKLSRDPEQTLERVHQILDGITGYFSIKFYTSTGTGVCAGLLTWALGVDSPLLWGFVAFLMNFVPNIGSFLAAIPPVLLAVIQPDLGLGSAGLVVLGYVVINVVIGTVLEPRYLGRGLGLSTIVVFASLVFWGWVLGPMGMLLSVPLTITVKIALEAFPETKGLALLLGSDVGPETAGSEPTEIA